MTLQHTYLDKPICAGPPPTERLVSAGGSSGHGQAWRAPAGVLDASVRGRCG